MTTIRTGIDMVHETRFAETITNNQNIISNLFHPSEIRLSEQHRLAGIFALKEATFKALDMKEKRWLEIEIGYRRSGKPCITLLNESKIMSVDASVSHDGDYVIGMVTFLLR